MTDAPRRGVRRTVRAKVVATTLAVTALGLTGAGLATYAIQRQDLDGSIDAELVRAADQFRQVALANADLPVDEVLRTAMQQTLPDPSDGSIALVDGVPAWYAPAAVPVRLETDPELVAVLRAVPADDPVRLRTVVTSRAEYRVVTVPLVVLDPAAPAGLFAAATVRDLEVAALDDTWRTYAAVAAGALVVTGVVAWLLLGRVLRPLRALRSTAARIDEGTLDVRVPVSTDDDVGEVGLTVNAILDRLQASMEAQRRLLDDVGHELRTPLTVIGGHLELMDVADADDVRATRELALDEVDRMRLLVDDLLVQGRIFERFERTSGAAGTEGAGLGLAIVAAIARAHGGRVDVSSEPGIGSTFVVTVPATPAPGTSDEPADDIGDDAGDERSDEREPDDERGTTTRRHA